jgi:hypothetical protein
MPAAPASTLRSQPVEPSPVETMIALDARRAAVQAPGLSGGAGVGDRGRTRAHHEVSDDRW